MIGRLLEDALFVSRFGWFYYRAPVDITSVGFNPNTLTKKERVKYAWNRAHFGPQR